MLSGAEARAWWQARIPGAIGLGSTLLIAAYLMLAIKRRFEEKGSGSRWSSTGTRAWIASSRTSSSK